MGWVPNRRAKVRQELEAMIEQKKAELADLEGKLAKLVNEVPSEFHNITRELWAKLKEIFD